MRKHWKPLRFSLLVLSVLILLLGLWMIFSAAGSFRQAMDLADPQLMELWDSMAQKLIAGCILSVIALSSSLFLLCFNRTAAAHRKEEEALRRKKEAAESLNRQNQQLAHHQRLHILGTLTSSIAHEFNNLLTPIMGYSMMALEKIPPEDESLYDDILEIYNVSCKAKTIISRLSDLSRKNTDTSFRQVSPDDVIRKTLDVAAPAKPEQVEVRVNLNCWEQRIQANEIQLSQLLLNLILNSYDAIGTQEGILQIQTSFDETAVCIRVSDTGCGIPAEVLPRIYEPFFTTKEAGKGTGLGLAIAAQVVEDHQGSIQVDSTPGSGTVFTIRIPRTLPPVSEE